MLVIIMLSLNIICSLVLIFFCSYNIIDKTLTKYGEDFFMAGIVISVAMLFGSAFTLGSVL